MAAMENGRTVVVTGGAGGIGTVAVAAFVAAGWRVVAPVRPGRSAALPEGATPVEADLTDVADVAAAIEAAAGDPAAPLRAVVNLAGGYRPGQVVAETPWPEVESLLTANLRPAYLVTAAALPHLVAAGGGSVVSVASRAALTPYPTSAAYSIAKAAVLTFAEAVAADYKQQNVRSNTILPSVVDTAANRSAMPDADFSRWVPAEAVARTILFLASDDSAPTTGARIPMYARA
jgi:NAD(P)-dependent dehydrogenase (short-subunit alcohol dehydrogenase family)